MKPLHGDNRINPIRALAEVTLIAMGVLAGLSAEAWLNSREDRSAELFYLEALEGEMEANLGWLSGTIEQAEQQRADGEAIIRVHLSEGPTARVPLEQVLNLFGFGAFKVTTATVDQLVASGDLSLIESNQLRTSLAGWSANARAWSEYVNQEQWDNWNLSSQPLLEQEVGAVEYYAALAEWDIPGSQEERSIAISPRTADVIALRLVVLNDVAGIAALLRASAESVLEELAEAR